MLLIPFQGLQTTLMKSRVGTSHTKTSNQSIPPFQSNNTSIDNPSTEVQVPNELDSFDTINQNADQNSVPSREGDDDSRQGISFSKGPTLRRKHRVRFRSAKSSKPVKKKAQKQRNETDGVCPSSQYRSDLLDALETGSLLADVGAVSGVEHHVNSWETSRNHTDDSELPADIRETSRNHVDNSELPADIRETSRNHVDNSELPADIWETSRNHTDNSELPADIWETSGNHTDNSELSGSGTSTKPSDAVCQHAIKTNTEEHPTNRREISESLKHADNSELPGNGISTKLVCLHVTEELSPNSQEISPKHTGSVTSTQQSDSNYLLVNNQETPPKHADYSKSVTGTKPLDSVCPPVIKIATESQSLIRTTVEETPYLHVRMEGKSPFESKASPVVVQETPYVRLEGSEDEELTLSCRDKGERRKQWHCMDHGETPLISSSALDSEEKNSRVLTEGCASHPTQDINEGQSSILTQDTNGGRSSNLTQYTTEGHSSILTQDTNPQPNEVVLARETQLLSPKSHLTQDSLEPIIIAPTQVATVNETQTSPQSTTEPPETVTKGPISSTSTTRTQSVEPISNTSPEVSTSRGILRLEAYSHESLNQIIPAHITLATPDRSNFDEESFTPVVVPQVKGQMNSETAEDVSSRLSPVVMEMTPRALQRGEYSSPTIPLQNVVSSRVSYSTDRSVRENLSQSAEPERGKGQHRFVCVCCVCVCDPL